MQRSAPLDILITNGTVLTMDPHMRQVPHGAVAVRGDRIAAVAPAEELEDYPAAKVIDAEGGIIMPGLINTHTHAAMTCFRGLADDLPLMTWLNDHIFPAESLMDRQQVYTGTRLACAEMILSGTTCFCDMYLYEDAVAEAAGQTGMRAVVGEVLYDFPSPNYGSIEAGFAYTEALIERYRGDPLVSIAVEPHSPYLCAPDLIRKADRISREHQVPLVIHVAETQAEADRIQKEHGRTPVAFLADLGVLSPRLVACHCVAVTDEDISLLRRHQANVAHNPESNMKLASGIAPVPRMRQAGICVALGTDGCASNNDLDMFSEMDTAAKLHKVAGLDPTVMPAEAVLRMATTEGARALGLDRLTGSLEAGKKADVIVIETRRPHLTPMYHPVSQLVYAACGGDVRTSVINGRLVMENRRLLTIDTEEILAEAEQIAQRIRSQRSGGAAKN